MAKYFFSKSTHLLWDSICLGSIVGIWPRFIEPKLLTVTKKDVALPRWPKSLEGLKVVHFSDLHFQETTSSYFLKRIGRIIGHIKPDLILFTGDWINYGSLQDEERLISFLQSMQAPLGCFCILGNHDYTDYVTKNSRGELIHLSEPQPLLRSSLKFLIHGRRQNIPLKQSQNPPATTMHRNLLKMLSNTPFQLLHNLSVQIEADKGAFNLCGLGDLWSGHFDPDHAFKDYDPALAGIVLSHNPDSFDILSRYPGELLLAGHTHGGQINLPWLWKRFIGIDNFNYKRGLKRLGSKLAYIHRGVGAQKPFRLFSPPEILYLTIRSAP